MEEKEQMNKHGLGSAPSATRGKSMWHFCAALCIFSLSRACILRETSTKPLGMLAHLLTTLLPSSHCLLLLCSSLDSYLKPTVLFCPPLSTASLCLLWDLSSLVHFRSRGRSHPQALCVGIVPKQTKRFSDRHQHKRKWMPPTVSHKSEIVKTLILWMNFM